MGKKDRINRKQKRLERKQKNKDRDGILHNENTSDKGSHRERTLFRERQKLLEKHFNMREK